MTAVRIAELKSRLSAYLQQVRHGHEVTVFDRETAIARIVPYQSDAAALSVRAPGRRHSPMQSVPLPPPLEIRGDIVTLLLDERQVRR
jgi:antitoxin (DNA-binding transcriptional repressor) of toxin-antitoxin stability system